MIRHLSAADYRVQPWANGRGQTLELLRLDGRHGLLLRLSVAAVVENGPFSRFPGINRSLTVIRGAGFMLRGQGIALRAAPMVPVAFPGDIDIAAEDVTGPSDDFNVMTAAHLPPAVVTIAGEVVAAGGLLALYAIGDGIVAGRTVAPGDLVLTDGAASVTGGPVLAARIQGLSDPEELLRQTG